jgi:hypothetical protein
MGPSFPAAQQLPWVPRLARLSFGNTILIATLTSRIGANPSEWFGPSVALYVPVRVLGLGRALLVPRSNVMTQGPIYPN